MQRELSSFGLCSFAHLPDDERRANASFFCENFPRRRETERQEKGTNFRGFQTDVFALTRAEWQAFREKLATRGGG